VRLYLQTVGLDVRTAGDGAEAVSLARGTLPDVMVFDVDLLGLREAVAQIRRGPATARIPMVLKAATGVCADLPRVDATIRRPCTPSELLGIIRRFGGRA
jgi:DNA-binding response OmpR family regulator